MATIIILLIVAAAAGLAARHLYKSRKGGGCGCGCTGCSSKDQCGHE